MSIIEQDRAVEADDSAAIEELDQIVKRQRAAFLADPYPSLEERQSHLMAIAGMLLAARTEIEEAMSSDFGVHPALSADLIEVLGVAGRAAYAAENLGSWMETESRYSDPAIYGSGKAFVQPQPKGVIGNISPWNFPFDLSVGPLVEMLAAGNRVVLKPSEHTPACSELLREMVRETFDGDRVDVAVGGIDLAKAFSNVRWDHLLYTGSPDIGRQIALAAADKLVPTTLELGGKCPTILTEDAINAESLKQVLGTKALKNGQMCITVDYCMVPRDRMEDFADLAVQHVRENMPDFTTSESNTGIITERHLDRIQGLLDDARSNGADVRPLEEAGEVDRGTRQLPISLVIDPSDESAVMKDEIFGPILPVKPYDSIDEAIDYINSGERPLALYVFTEDEDLASDVLRRTTSGGACVNSAAVHGALPSLPFGGIGQSGMGRHHGIEGFREFSNQRGVFVRGEGDLLEVFSPPYDETAQAVVNAALDEAGAGDAGA